MKFDLEISANIPDNYETQKRKDEYKSEYQLKTIPPPIQKDWEISPPENVKFKELNTKNGVRKVVCGQKLVLSLHNNGIELLAFCPFDKKNWVEFIKTIPGRKWNPIYKCWIIPYVMESIEMLKGYFGNLIELNIKIRQDLPQKWINPEKKAKISLNQRLNEFHKRALIAVEETMLLERKSWRTIKTYKNYLISLFLFYPNNKPSQISEYEIKQFLIYKIREKKISNSTHNTIISAFNTFFGRTLGQMDKVQQLKRPPKLRTLPNIISEKEMSRFLGAAENLKHKCMLLLLYSAGLRKGELLNLLIEDLNKERKVLFVRNGKGGADRTTFYSDTAIEYIQKYLKLYKPQGWLFEGATGGKYSESSLQKIFSKTKRKSGINPRLTIHGLRHSFATHLREHGVALDIIQDLLGHKSVRSTEIYLHLAKDVMNKIKSPLENLNL